MIHMMLIAILNITMMSLIIMNLFNSWNIFLLLIYFNLMMNFSLSKFHYVMNMLILEMMMTINIPMFMNFTLSQNMDISSMFLFLTLVISEAIVGLSILIFSFRKANKSFSKY